MRDSPMHYINFAYLVSIKFILFLLVWVWYYEVFNQFLWEAEVFAVIGWLMMITLTAACVMAVTQAGSDVLTFYRAWRAKK